MAILDKTIAFISGANQGIGLATATRLAQEHNYHVIIGSRNIENGRTIVDELKAKGLSADTVQLDVLSDDSITTATTYLTKTYGHSTSILSYISVYYYGPELSRHS
jgi:NAD(P)-dependent dehydrogenase (short-subunit alcohol dehydrogenase family)